MFCERACRRKDIDQPVSVCALKRFAADWDMASKEPYRPVKKPPTGRKVAIVGSGIAGLTAAYFLLQDGHECMVFDSRERPGGIIRHAIPDFRLPASVVDYEIGRVKELGAQFVLGTSLGVQISLQDLRRDFDAVLLATGAPMEILPAIEGIEQAILAARFLEDVKEGVSSVGIAGAIVIGAGPAGPDAARALRRLGTSKVTLIPVGRPIDAAADEMHRENARKEGVEVLLDTTVETIERLDKFGFMIVIDRNGKRESLTAEQVLVSGETAENEKFFADLGIEGTPKGETVDRETMATNVQGVFAAGSVVRRRIHAVQASAMGSLAAGSISDYLSRKSRPKKRPIHVIMRDLSKEELGRMLEDASQKHRFDTRRSDRATMHAETDQGFDEDTAEREAKRCLQCACVAKNDCLLRDLSTEFDADPRAYVGERKKFERDTSHEYVVYESSKCIRCMKCVLIAEDADESLGLAVIGRGFQVRVGVPFNENIKAGLRETAARCAEACPTGALRTRQETR